MGSKKNRNRESNWLDRALIVGPCYTLCTHEDQYLKIIKRLKLKEYNNFILNDYSDATVHYFDRKEGFCCVVCIRKKEDSSLEVIAGLLCHEAVHIWQEFSSKIGEKKPSEEFEAYSVQTIFQRLFQEYIRQTNASPNT